MFLNSFQGGSPPLPTGSARCSKVQFYCKADDLCINIHWKCDGEKDCTDGADEMLCPSPTKQPTPPPGLTHPANCNFESGFCLWRSATFADMNWLRNRGQTPSRQTGPDGDHTTGTGMSNVLIVLPLSTIRGVVTYVLNSRFYNCLDFLPSAPPHFEISIWLSPACCVS